ncbi:MAD2 mitotic arrest deficient-like 2 [Podila verticillata]|nr:MAD2 mitotic arrest deficient-like 2 [Podila verticillata]
MQQLSLASVALPDVLSEFLEVAIHMILFVRGIYPPELFESTQKYSCPLKTARHPDLVSYIQHIVQGIRTELQKDTVHRICVVTLDSSKRAVDRFVFETNVFRPFHDEQSNTNAHDSTLDAARVDKGKGKAVDEYDYQHEDDEHLRDEDMDEDEDDEPLHKTRPEGWEKRHQMDSYNPSLAMYSRGAERQGARVNGTVILNTDLEAMLRAMLLKISICDSYLPPLGQDCSFTVLIEMKSSNTGPEAKAKFPWAPVSALSLRDHGKVSAPVDNPGPKRKITPVKTIEIADVQLELYIEQLP